MDCALCEDRGAMPPCPKCGLGYDYSHRMQKVTPEQLAATALAFGQPALMLAAPDLLDALEELLPWAAGTHNGTLCDCDRCEAITNARAAIAKARGES